MVKRRALNKFILSHKLCILLFNKITVYFILCKRIVKNSKTFVTPAYFGHTKIKGSGDI